MIIKITEEDRENLILKRIEKIDTDKKYALELFELYYKDVPRENYNDWKISNTKKKRKIIKQIIKWEDDSVLRMGLNLFKFKIKKQLQYANDFKINQLKEFGIVKNGN